MKQYDPSSRGIIFSITERATARLFFLFPLFAVSIRHWASATFILIFLLSLFSLGRVSGVLAKKEIIFLFAGVGFFLSYVISGIANGWDQETSRIMEREIRYLMAFPILWTLIRSRHYIRYFSYGAAISLVITVPIVLYQYHFLNFGRDLGVYGPLFTGPFSVIMFAVVSVFFKEEIKTRGYFFFYIFLAACSVTIAVYTSRSAVLAFFVFMLAFLLMNFSRKKVLILVAAIIFSVAGSARILGDSAQVNNLSGGYSELSGYMDSLINRPDETNPYGEGSIGKRLEMFRASYYVFLDSPWFGVGGYNFQHRVGDYLAENNIHPSLAHSNHPHNVIAEVLVSKGMVGMLFFSMMLYVLLAPTKYGGALSVEWRLVILTLLITMVTESAVVLKNNFISTFILVAIIAMAASRGGRDV